MRPTKRSPGTSAAVKTRRTPGIVSADASGLSIQSVFSYSINCTSAAGAPTSASGGSPLTVSGFTRGVAYSCLGQAYSGSTLVANSMAFNVTVGAPAPTIPGTTAPAAIPTAITDFGGASDIGSNTTTQGREHAYVSVDAFVGQVIAGLGYWRLGLSNLTNARKNRERVDADSAGGLRTERSVERYQTRVFLSVGTRW